MSFFSTAAPALYTAEECESINLEVAGTRKECYVISISFILFAVVLEQFQCSFLPIFAPMTVFVMFACDTCIPVLIITTRFPAFSYKLPTTLLMRPASLSHAH